MTQADSLHIIPPINTPIRRKLHFEAEIGDVARALGRSANAVAPFRRAFPTFPLKGDGMPQGKILTKQARYTLSQLHSELAGNRAGSGNLHRTLSGVSA